MARLGTRFWPWPSGEERGRCSNFHPQVFLFLCWPLRHFETLLHRAEPTEFFRNFTRFSGSFGCLLETGPDAPFKFVSSVSVCRLSSCDILFPSFPPLLSLPPSSPPSLSSFLASMFIACVLPAVLSWGTEREWLITKWEMNRNMSCDYRRRVMCSLGM